MALFFEGCRKEKVVVNSLFSAPGNKTLQNNSELYIQTLNVSYRSAFGVLATPLLVCQIGVTLGVLEALKQIGELQAFLQYILRGPWRKDMLSTQHCNVGRISVEKLGKLKVTNASSARPASAEVNSQPYEVAKRLDITARAFVSRKFVPSI